MFVALPVYDLTAPAAADHLSSRDFVQVIVNTNNVNYITPQLSCDGKPICRLHFSHPPAEILSIDLPIDKIMAHFPDR